MTTEELEQAARELKELERLREGLDAQIIDIQDTIKAALMEMDTDATTAGVFKISWKTVEGQRLDTASLKRELPEIVSRFVKPYSTRRFIVSA